MNEERYNKILKAIELIGQKATMKYIKISEQMDFFEMYEQKKDEKNKELLKENGIEL